MHDLVLGIAVFSYFFVRDSSFLESLKYVWKWLFEEMVAWWWLWHYFYVDQDESEKSLLEAARLGNVEQVAELIKQGVRISCKDDSGYSALHWASLYGHINVHTVIYRSSVKFWVI